MLVEWAYVLELQRGYGLLAANYTWDGLEARQP